MSTENTIRSSDDTAFWLREYQKTIANVQSLISTGRSESASNLINELASRWCRGCQIKIADTMSLVERMKVVGRDGKPRNIYRGQRTGDYFLTYGGTVTEAEVVDAAERGLIVRDYDSGKDFWKLADV